MGLLKSLRHAGFIVATAAFFFVAGRASNADPVVRAGDTLGLCGDSLTEGRDYTEMIEEYILMCQPIRNITPVEFGFGGSTAPHLASHMKNDILTFKPSVATVLFGMNDGNYDLLNDTLAANFRSGLTKSIDAFKANGTRSVIVASPPVVDTTYFHNPHHANVSASQYNESLGELGDIAKDVAEKEGVMFADVHTQLASAMIAAKAKYGDKYPVCGNQDGVHGGPNEHLVIAYALLKAMGFDGNIGTITYDMATGAATATDGHRIVSAGNGQITVESERYPFCFFSGLMDADKDEAVVSPLGAWPNGDAGMLPFVPFNRDLNRFTLVVKNIPTARARVTWGAESKEFTASELARGINLADVFLKNPFTPQFFAIAKLVDAKQDFETTFVKGFLYNRATYASIVPSKVAALQQIDAGFREFHGDLEHQCSQAVTPVIHTINVTALD